MEEAELGCCVCHERYDETRCPKNLGCGHAVCSLCVQQIINSGRKCPECRRPFYATTAAALPVNYPLLRLSRALASVSLQRGQPQALSPSSGATRSQNDAGECAAHLSRLTQRCITCRVWVCRECVLMDHTLPPEGQCRLLPVRQAINEMKKTHVETLASKVISLRELKTSAATQGGCLEANQKIRNTVAASLQAAARAELDAVKELDAKKKEVEGKVGEIDGWVQGLREKESAVMQATTVRELATAALAARELLNATETRAERERERQARFLGTQLRLGSLDLRGSLQLARTMYVAHQSEEGRRWARLSMHDSFLHLHALQASPPPASAPVFSFSSVRSLVPRDSPSAFLEVGWEGVSQGRVLLTMMGDTARARQFLQLCSGEGGPCYRGTCMFQAERVGGHGEIIRGGDYEHNDGTGGAAVVEGVATGGEHLHDAAPGLVVGAHSGQQHRLAVFGVILSPWSEHKTDTAFAAVTSGLGVLRAAARTQPVTQVTVLDCGIRVPL
ncbi:Peptidyl-prolyl cis-trans isomerase B1 [Chionoecetes opilio]|uniref:Peptidyl-prolyl cis-trans isomerase B1 n=1 Tax=Chionoecetes opilio TaxID=41210 RepID=A0A8J4Y872_CHIOP|nr:Peptidyl-prolyl cis-trans isomerase B1 [Chionoecetes opilio]